MAENFADVADKIPTQKSKPVNTSYFHQRKPTTKVRMKDDSKWGQKLKSTLARTSGVILILAAGLDSVGRRPVNARLILDKVYRNGF